MTAAQEKAWWDGWLAAAAEIEAPYPADVFTPLSEAELKWAITCADGAVPNAGARMHAAWARHWAKVLREFAP